MFLGMNARHTPVHQRAKQKFQPPAYEHNGRRRINEDELVGRLSFQAAAVWILLQNKVRQVVDRKTPYPVGINELGVIWQRRDEFNTAAKLAFGFEVM